MGKSAIDKKAPDCSGAYYRKYNLNYSASKLIAAIPRNNDVVSRSSSILSSWLYFAILSVLLAEPVLI